MFSLVAVSDVLRTGVALLPPPPSPTPFFQESDAMCLEAFACQSYGLLLRRRVSIQIEALVAHAGSVALARVLGGDDADWLAQADAGEEGDGDGLAVKIMTGAPGTSATSSEGTAYPGSSTTLLVGGDPMVREGRQGSYGGMSKRGGGDSRGLVLTVKDLEEAERKLPPSNSSMKMGCPRIPQVMSEAGSGLGIHSPVLQTISLLEKSSDGKLVQWFSEPFRRSFVRVSPHCLNPRKKCRARSRSFYR